jgi:hypothetical protein
MSLNPVSSSRGRCAVKRALHAVSSQRVSSEASIPRTRARATLSAVPAAKLKTMRLSRRLSKPVRRHCSGALDGLFNETS